MAGKAAGAAGAEMRAKIEKLEMERSGLLEKLRQAEAAHKSDVAALKKEVEDVKGQKDRASKEEALLKSMSEAVLNLYREVKDRKAFKVTDAMDKEYAKLSQGNPMVVVSYLRTHLRCLIANYEDKEMELRATLKMAVEDASRTEHMLKGRVSSALEREARAIALANGATSRLEDAELAKDSALNDTKGLVDQVKTDQMLLVQQLRAKGDENEKLQVVIQEKDKTLKKQEVQMLQMAKMESEIQSLKAQSLLERKKLESQHAAKMTHFEVEIQKMTRLEAENDRYREKLKALEEQIGRQNLSLVQTKLKEVQEKAERFEGMYMKKIKQVEELETKAKGFQHLAEKHAAEAEVSREKYKKLFEAVEAQQTAKSKPKVDTAKKAEELSIVYYKDLVKEKDKELAKLMSRTRQMSRVETTGKLAAKRFDDQRAEMSLRMGQVLTELEREREMRRDMLGMVPPEGAAVSGGAEAAAGPVSGGHRARFDETGPDAVVVSRASSADGAARDAPSGGWMQGAGGGVGVGAGVGGSRPGSGLSKASASAAVPVGRAASRPMSALSRRSNNEQGASSSSSSRPMSAKERGGAGRPMSALSRKTYDSEGGRGASRPSSAMTMRTGISDVESDEEATPPGSPGRVGLDMVGAGGLSIEEEGGGSRRMSLGASGGLVMGGGKMEELEEANRAMQNQLKHFHNVLAVSQGAADAYKAVVASLGGDAASSGGGIGSVGGGGGGSGLGGVSKLVGGRRGEVARARASAGGGGADVTGYKPPRPQSAPPGHHPGMIPSAGGAGGRGAAVGETAVPSTRASQASTPTHGKAQPAGGALSKTLLGGKPPQAGRPASALNKSPARWN